MNIERFNICPYLHAMSDFGFASTEDRRQGLIYGKSHTNNAECYADICKNNGKCLIAIINKKRRL